MNTWGVSWVGWGTSWDSQKVEFIKPSGGRLEPFEARDPYRFPFTAKQIKVIESVALTQVENLQLDDSQRFQQFHRELEWEGIEFEARYLEALNLERQRLIDAEISQRLKAILEDEVFQAMFLICLASI